MIDPLRPWGNVYPQGTPSTSMGVIDRLMDYLEARPELTNKLVNIMDERIARQEQIREEEEVLAMAGTHARAIMARMPGPPGTHDGQGGQGGPTPPVARFEVARALVADGFSVREAAKRTGLARTTLRRDLDRAEEGNH